MTLACHYSEGHILRISSTKAVGDSESSGPFIFLTKAVDDFESSGPKSFDSESSDLVIRLVR